jgi:hypothetical protein
LPPPHHHTSEHSNFWTIILHGSHRSIGQTTHCQKPGPIPANVRTSAKTSTRIQTHQNLFTLTKNSFVPPQQQDWEQHPVFQFPTFTGTKTKKPKLDFPHNILSVVSGQLSVVSLLPRPTICNRTEPLFSAPSDH